MAQSEIVEFFKDKSIFLTGSTGFIGKVCLEKLLRTCSSLKKIYLLVRAKRNKTVDERIDEIFGNNELMKLMKEKNPNYKSQVELMEGDLLEPYCGLSEENIEIIKENVEIIIHCAASIKLNETLKRVAYMNVRSLKDLIEISYGMKRLEVFAYLSTAFSHSYRRVIDEKCYSPPMKAEDFLTLVETLNDETLGKIQTLIKDKWLNTYTYSKAIAEDLISTHSHNLPMVIVRPSVVLASAKEPPTGWIDSISGPTALFIGEMHGLFRCGYSGGRTTTVYSDVVPVDFVVNATLAACYQKVKASRRNTTISEGSNAASLPIYNLSSTYFKPIDWLEINSRLMKLSLEIPPSTVMVYPKFTLIRCKYQYKIQSFCQIVLPSKIADLIMEFMGMKSLRLSDKAMKLKKSLEELSYFFDNGFDMRCAHLVKLWNSLNEKDKELFGFSFEDLEWEKYLENYGYGMRRYVLKESDDSIPESRAKLKRLYSYYIISNSIIILILCLIGYYSFRGILFLV